MSGMTLSTMSRLLRSRGWNALPLFMPGLALANPSGGVVVGGEVGFVTPDANTLLINQSSHNAAINWQSFSIQSSEYVIFNQPSASAVVLNRVVGGNPSEILGNLQANGRVFLINPLGVMFGEGAQVDVGGIVASTLDLNPDDFIAGRYVLRGDSQAGIVNAGNIAASDGGFVVLLGDHVSNTGAIHANLGSVVLASGSQVTLDFTGDGLIQHSIDTAAISDRAGVEHLGSIMADGGHVVMDANVTRDLKASVINTQGLVQARRIVKDASGGIYLTGRGGDIALGGTLDASGVADDAQGGRVMVTTDGDITMPSGSTIRAKGGSAARGGDVRVIAKGEFEFANGALIDATGGTRGGFVELSGHEHLTIRGDVKLGRGGTLLVDPRDVTIAAGYGPNFTDGTDVTLSEQFVEGQLQSGADVIIVADRSITLQTLTDFVLDGAYFDGMDYSGGSLTLGIGTVNGGAMPIMVPDDGYDAAYTGGLANFVRGAGYDGYGILFDAFEDGIRTYGGINIIGGYSYGYVDVGALETQGDLADIYVAAYGEVRLTSAITHGADSDIEIVSAFDRIQLQDFVKTKGADSRITLNASGDVNGNESGTVIDSDFADVSVYSATGSISNGLRFYAGGDVYLQAQSFVGTAYAYSEMGDITITSLSDTVSANSTSAENGLVSLTGGNVFFTDVDAYSFSVRVTNAGQGITIGGASFVFDGDVTFQADYGAIFLHSGFTLAADEITLTAGYGGTSDVALSGVDLSGRVLTATAYDTVTIDSGSTLAFTEPSSITARYGDLNFLNLGNALGNISLDAETGYVDLSGVTAVADVNAASFVEIGVESGSLTAGNITAGRYVVVDAENGNVDLGYVSAYGYVDISANNTGNNIAVDGVTLAYSDMADVEYGVSIFAVNNLDVGYITAGSAATRYYADVTDGIVAIAQQGTLTFGGDIRLHDYNEAGHTVRIRLAGQDGIFNADNNNAATIEASYGAGYANVILGVAGGAPFGSASLYAGDVVGDFVSISTYGGDASFYGVGGGDINSGSLNLFDVANFAADDLTIRSTLGITEDVSGDFTLTGTLFSEGSVSLMTSNGDISVGAVIAAGDITIDAEDALVVGGFMDAELGAVTLSAGNRVYGGFIAAGTSVTIGVTNSDGAGGADQYGVELFGDISAYGAGGVSISTVDGNIVANAGTTLFGYYGVSLTANTTYGVGAADDYGQISVGRITTSLSNISFGGVSLAADGDVLAGNINAYGTAISYGVTLTSVDGRDASVGDVDAASLTLSGIDSFSADSITIRSSEIGDSFFNAASSFTVTGALTSSRGADIRTASGDISIGSISLSNGALSLYASDASNMGADITVGAISVGNAVVQIYAADNITLNGDINTVSGNVFVTADYEAGDTTGDAIGSIHTTSSDYTITATNVALRATEGITAYASASTNVDFVNSATGDVTLGLSNVSSVYGTDAGSGNVNITATNGNLSVSSAGVSGGAGTISIKTNDGNLTTIGAVSSSNGAITLDANDGESGNKILTIGSSGVSSGSGAVTLRSDDDIVINGNVTGGSIAAIADNDDSDGTADVNGNIAGTGNLNSLDVELYASGGITAQISSINGSLAFTNKDSGNVSITNAVSGFSVDYGNNMAAAGSITLAASGAFNVNGALTSNNGAISITSGGNDAATQHMTIGASGSINAGTGDVVLRSIDNIEIGGGGISTTGDVTLVADYAGTDSIGQINSISGGQVTADHFSLTAASAIGSGTGDVRTDVNTLSFYTATGPVGIIELNGLTVYGSDGSSNIDIVSQSGNLVVGGTGITGNGGAVTLDAENGDVVVNAAVSTSGAITVQAGDTDTGSNATVTINAGLTSSTATITLESADNIVLNAPVTASTGNLAMTANRSILETTADNYGGISGSGLITGNDLTLAAATGISLNTDINSVSVSSGSGGNISLVETNGLTIDSTGMSTSSGDISVRVIAGDLTQAGTVNPSGGDVNFDAETGNIVGSTFTINGDLINLYAGAADGYIGTSTTAIKTGGNTISFTAQGAGGVYINEGNAASFYGSTGSGDIVLSTALTTGALTVGGDITTTGDVTLSAAASDIVYGAGVISGDVVTLSAGGTDGDVGLSTASIRTDATSISFTAAGTGEAAIRESNGASFYGSTGGSGAIRLETTIGDLSIGGTILTSGTAVLDAEAGDVLHYGGTGRVQANLLQIFTGGPDGDIGTSTSRILTSATTLHLDASSGGDIYVNEANAVTVSVAATTAAGIFDLNIAGAGDVLWGSGAFTFGGAFVTTTDGSILRSGGGIFTANQLVLTANGTNRSIGTSGNAIETRTVTGSFQATGTGAVYITERADDGAATFYGSTGSGTIDLRTTAGNLTVGGDISTTGNVTLAASSGDIVYGSGVVSGNLVTLTAGGTGGDVGYSGGVIRTDASEINFAATGTVYIRENNAALISGTAAGAVSVVNGSGDLTLGNISSGGNTITLVAEAGNLVRSSGTVSANNLVTLIAGGTNGAIGSAGAGAIQTHATSVEFSAEGAGGVYITETTNDANDVRFYGDTGSGVIDLRTMNRNLMVGHGSSSGYISTTGAVSLMSGRDISDGHSGVADIYGASIALYAGTAYSGYGIGSMADALDLASVVIHASASGGSVDLTNAPAGTVTITGLTTSGTGAVRYSQNGQVLNINGAITSGSGGVVIDPPTDVLINARINGGGGDVTIEANNNITFNNGGYINNAANVTLRADDDYSGVGAIIDAQTTELDDITASGLVNLSAYTGIGSLASNRLEISAPMLTLNNSSGGVRIQNLVAVEFTGASAVDSLALNAVGNVTDETNASLVVTGQALFQSGAGSNFILGNSGTDNIRFGSLFFGTSGIVNISEDDSTALSGGTTLSAGFLTLNSADAITDGSVNTLTVTNNASFSGTTITLGDNANDNINFGSLTVNSTGAVSIAEDSATQVYGSNTASTLTLNSGGDITQSAGSTVRVTNNAYVNAGAYDIALTNAGNDFDTTIYATGRDIRLSENGFLNTNLTAGRDAYLLTEDMYLGATVVVGTVGRNLYIDSKREANLSSITVGGDLDIAVRISGGGNTSIYQQPGTMLQVTGNSTFSAPTNIFLDNTGNDFGGAVSATGANVILRDANDISLGTVALSGDLTVTAGDSLFASSALSVPGFVNFEAGTDINIDAITAGFNAGADAYGFVKLTAVTGYISAAAISGYGHVELKADNYVEVGDITALTTTATDNYFGVSVIADRMTLGSITVGSADSEFIGQDAYSVVLEASGGNIVVSGGVRIYGSDAATVEAYGSVDAQVIEAFYGSSYGNIFVRAGALFGDINDAGGDVSLSHLAGYDVTVTALSGMDYDGDVTVGDVYAAGSLLLNAGGQLTTGAQTIGESLIITADTLSFAADVTANLIDLSITGDNSNFSFTNLTATGGYVTVATADGFISGEDVTAAQGVTLMAGDYNADGDSGITVGTVTANGAYGITLSGYGDISADRLIALGDSISIDANGYDVDVTDGGAGQISAATLSLINVNRFIVDSLALSHTGLNTFSIGDDFILNESLTSTGDVSITTAEDIDLNGYVDVAGYVTLSANGASGVMGATDANVYGDQGVTILASAADINLIGSVHSSAGYVDIRAFNELDIDGAVYGQADVSLFGENGFVDLAAVASNNGTVTISGNTLTLNGAISGDAVDIHAYGAYASSAGSISFFGDITSDIGSVNLTTEDNLIQGNGAGTNILGYGGVSILMQGDEGHLSFLNDVSSSNGNVVITSEAIDGRGISIDGALQAYGNLDLTALTGNIAFGAGGADAETGYLSANSTTLGFLFSDLSAGTDVTLTVTGGGNGIRLNHNITAGGVITATATNSDITGFDTAYVISGAGGITLDAEGGQVNVSQTLTSASGGIALHASDFIHVSDLNSYAGASLDAEGGIARADTTDGALFTYVAAYGDVSLTNSGGGLVQIDTALTSDTGSITVTNAGGGIVSSGLLSAAGDVALVASQNISLNDVTTGGLLSIDAEAGDLTLITGAYVQANLIKADAVNIFGDGFDVAAVTDFYLTATGGDITLTDGDIVAGNLADLHAYDSLTLINTNITAGSLALDAGGDVSLDPLELRSDNDISINAGGYVMGDQVGLYAGTTLEIDAGSFVQFDASGLYSSGLSVDASSTIDLAGASVSVLGYGSVADDFAVNESALTDPDLPFVPVSANPNARFRAGSVSLGELNLTGDYLFIATDNLSLTPSTLLGVPVDILVQLTAFTPSANLRIVDNPAGLTLVAGDVYFSRVNHFDKFPGTTYVFGSDGYNGQIIIGENGPVAGNNADFLFFTNGSVSGAGLITTTGSVATLDLISSTALGNAAEIINEINNNIVGDTSQQAANARSVEDAGPVDESAAQSAEDDDGVEDEDDETASTEGDEAVDDDKFEGQTDSETNSVLDQECTS